MNCKFDRDDWFPLLEILKIPYAELKAHSTAVDEFLGFQIPLVEAHLQKDVSREEHGAMWIGLPPESLQTPYLELRFMLSKLGLQNGEKVVDLGAGYGRLAHVMHAHFPGCDFLGVEISRARVKEGNRVLSKFANSRGKLIAEDASREGFHLPRAEFYFLYDLSDRATICRVLEKLKEVSKSQRIRVIGRGRATRDQIERGEPWLSQVETPKHYGNFTVYSSA